MTTNTRQPNSQRITTRRIGTVLGVLLALQPAAGLAAVNSTLAVPEVTAEEQLLAQRGSRGGGGSRSGGSRSSSSRSSSRSSGSRSSSRSSSSRSSSSRSSSGRTGFSNYSGSRQGQARSNSSSRQSSRQSSRSSNSSSRQSNRQSNSSSRQSNRSSRQSEVRSNSSSRQSNRQGSRNTRQTDRNEAINSRQGGRNDRVDTRQSNRTDRFDNRSDTRRKAINNWDRYGSGWYSSNGWYNNRPWNYGWYGGSYWNNWGWYPGQAAAWGLASMATFGVINSLVNSAQSNQVSYIVVPDSEYSLYYPSVTATGDTVTFEADNGNSTARYYGDCREGTLNGGTPRNANEAQLLNAACQVAFGQ